jgi:hypothetical protein
MSDQFQRIWEKAVTGNGEKLCNGDFVFGDRFLRIALGCTGTTQKTDSKCVQYIRKKFFTLKIKWDKYTWKSIILKLILNSI